MLKESEQDRAVRLKANQQLVQELRESEADRAARQEGNRRLEELLKESEADRAARLEAIHKLEGLLKESEEKRADLEAFKSNKWVRRLIRLGLVDDGETGEEKS